MLNVTFFDGAISSWTYSPPSRERLESGAAGESALVLEVEVAPLIQSPRVGIIVRRPERPGRDALVPAIERRLEGEVPEGGRAEETVVAIAVALLEHAVVVQRVVVLLVEQGLPGAVVRRPGGENGRAAFELLRPGGACRGRPVAGVPWRSPAGGGSRMAFW